jgi:hypothetical protein
MSARAGAGLAVGLAIAVSLAAAAWAAIPSARRVGEAIAGANREAGRAQPLWIELSLRDEAGEVAATGRGILDPRGHARLELALQDGRTEIHERDPSGYRVTRDRVPVEHAPPLLPPSQLLQAGTETELAAALVALGGAPDRVDLGMDGASDCWVLGGRDPGPFEANGRPSLWFDLTARRPVRIDEGPGVHFRLGPPARHGGVTFPAWIEVEAAGWPRWRMELQRVAPAPRERGPGSLDSGGPGAALRPSRAGDLPGAAASLIFPGAARRDRGASAAFRRRHPAA